MALNNLAVVTGPSNIAPTGGTALTFTSNGFTGPGKLTLVVPADTDLRLRRSMDVTVKQARVSSSAPNGYTQPRITVIYKKPKLLANGKITVNTIKVEAAYDVETTQTEIQELIDVAAQVCSDSDVEPTFKLLSLN